MSLLTSKLYHFKTNNIAPGTTWDVFADFDNDFPAHPIPFGKDPLDKIHDIAITYNREIEVQIGLGTNDWIILRNASGGPNTWMLNNFFNPIYFNISELKIKFPAGDLATVDVLIVPRNDGTVYN